MRSVWSELSRNDYFLEIIPANGFGVIRRGRRNYFDEDFPESSSAGFVDSLHGDDEENEDCDEEDDGFS
jgi:hypothetical protein